MRVCDSEKRSLSDRAEAGANPVPIVVPEMAVEMVRAEANLLRFPLFALHTKGIRSLDGIRCSGRQQRHGKTVQFTFTATRNTSTLYPGPLARSVHLAFLSLLTEAGSPAKQPITWTWRDLCRRMGVVCGGQIVRELKKAVLSTAGLLIRSESALYAKLEGKRIDTREEALHLYERVAFTGSTLPDGSVADQNYLWLSDWYRQNLDAYFSAPLDFALWKHLEARSAIASRLYEFLLVNFYSDAPALQFNYETLTQYLPIKSEKYLSSARRQLGSAFELLQKSAIVGKVDWRDSKSGLAQIVIERGRRLYVTGPQATAATSPAKSDPAESVAIEELRNQRPPEWFLVSDFYRDYAGNLLHRPSPKEMNTARELIKNHGVGKARLIVAAAVKQLKVNWPEAKTFGAVKAYLPEAIAVCTKEDRRSERLAEAESTEQQEQQQRSQRAEEQVALRAKWAALADSERDEIRESVLIRQPRSLKKFPTLVERLCLEEFERRQTEIIATH